MHEAKYKRGHPRIHRHKTPYFHLQRVIQVKHRHLQRLWKKGIITMMHDPLRPQDLPRKHSRFSWHCLKCTWTFLYRQPQVHNDTKVDVKNDLRFSLLLYGACLLKEPTKARECRQPPREVPPKTKVMRRRPDRQRQIRIRETPWTCLSIYPKTRICLSYYFVPFTNSSDINRGLSPTTFLWRKST